MQKNKIAAALLGMGLMAGALALPVTVSTTMTYAATEIIGHGEWLKKGDHWYYYQNGKLLKDCWLKDGIDWYYLNADGTMKADEFARIDNDWYYFRSWGGRCYNQKMTISGEVYVFDENGHVNDAPESIETTDSFFWILIIVYLILIWLFWKD